EALRLKEQHGGEVVVLCMGPASALATVRKALSMGPDAAVHVHDDALHGSCALNTATVLQAALRQVEPDIVLCGSESTDARTSLVPSALAEKLGWPGLTGAKQLEVDGSTVRVHRDTENGYHVLEAYGPSTATTSSRPTPRPWSAWSRASTSPATRPSRASWPPSPSR